MPPTGAKGLNLAAADVHVLARACRLLLRLGLAPTCSTTIRATALRRVWRAQHFSWWMTSHAAPLPRSGRDFDLKRQLAELTSS